jgi:hypothetical protein
MTLAALSANSPGAWLLISELLLFWSIVSYAVVSDPVRLMNRLSADNQPVPRFWSVLLLVRSLAMALITFLIGGANTKSLFLSLCLGTASLLLPIARRWWVAPDYGAELEIGMSTFVVILIVACVVHWHLVAHRAWTALPFPESKTSTLCLMAAIVIFNIRGGTYVVRGILNKCGALPSLEVPKASSVVPRLNLVVSEKSVDTIEFNRGRWIGNLERLLLLAIVAQGSYAALAFLMAAKSLIRSRDLENRDWAEYFLLGTLASIAVSLAGGLLIRQVLRAFW